MAWIEIEEEQEGYFLSKERPIYPTSDSNEHDKLVEQPEQQDHELDEESDLDADISRGHGPTTSIEKRRAQNSIMKDFAANISARLTQEEVEDAAAKSAKEEQLSIRDILAKQETTVRITNPRDYQTELFQRAKCENIIAVLDTGSGKTHIATLLLRHILDMELDHRAKGGIPKIAFFLVSIRDQLSHTQLTLPGRLGQSRIPTSKCLTLRSRSERRRNMRFHGRVAMVKVDLAEPL
jgi:endoribonuclease Dicer